MNLSTPVPYVRLGDQCEVTRGISWERARESSSGIPALTIPNIQETLDLSKLTYLSGVPAAHVEKARVRSGHTIMVGSNGNKNRVGDCLYFPHDTHYVFASFLLGVRPKLDSQLDSQYVYYWLSSPEFRAPVQAALVGATSLGNLRVNAVRDAMIPAPPIPVQKRIAGTLSAYDELIENSQRRIRLLESMARALYREWFVHFRFPSHEHHPRVASPLGEIPKGWEVKEMQEVADVVDCLHSKKPAECADGSGVLLQLNNIGEGGKLDMRKQFRIGAEDYGLWTSRIELHPGDCVVTNVGRVGAVAQMPEGVKAAPGRNMTAIRAREGRLTPTFLIEYLLSSHMESEVAKKKDLGTIMDSLNVKGIIRLHVPCPPCAAMTRFENAARPFRRRIELLVEQVQNLRRTRDLLLPRLLSGQIEVKAA